MRKEKIHHVQEAVQNGKVDTDTVVRHANHALDQIKAGHYRLENMSETDRGNGRVTITFDRVETDPKDLAHSPSN